MIRFTKEEQKVVNQLERGVHKLPLVKALLGVKKYRPSIEIDDMLEFGILYPRIVEVVHKTGLTWDDLTYKTILLNSNFSKKEKQYITDDFSKELTKQMIAWGHTHVKKCKVKMTWIGK